MTEKDNSVFTYNFSKEEMELLAKFIRKNNVPDGLGRFRDIVYNYIYSNMTIDEAEIFFNE